MAHDDVRHRVRGNHSGASCGSAEDPRDEEVASSRWRSSKTGAKATLLAIAATLSALCLASLLVVQLFLWRETRNAKYDYKVLSYAAEGAERTGDAAMKYTSITPSEKELSALGADGWEIVGSYLEIETAYPNFGKAEYVTGLQPNVRPQRLVVIVRRRAS